MGDSKRTIRVDESEFEEAKRRKEDAGQTWGEYLTDENRGRADPDAVATELTAKVKPELDDEALGETREELEQLADRIREIREMDAEELTPLSEAGANAGPHADEIAEAFAREFPYDEMAETTAKKTADMIEEKRSQF